MSVSIELGKNVAHLHNEGTSLVLEVVGDRYVVMRHLGAAIRTWHGSSTPLTSKRSYAVELGAAENRLYADELPFVYPTSGQGDTRPAAFVVERENGLSYSRLHFESWQKVQGKPTLGGLPGCSASSEQAATLAVRLCDHVLGIAVDLYYTLYSELDALLCHAVVSNEGSHTLALRDARSVCLSLPPDDYEAITLYGEHTREGNVSRHPLHVGHQGVDSRTGSSSPYAQPFLAVCRKGATERTGEVWATQLVYSGNHSFDAYVDQTGSVRMRAGINPEGFSWSLQPGQQFCTPEAVVVHSASGLDAISQTFHRLYLKHLMPARFRNVEHPILLNSWESMYYDVSLKKIEAQAKLAANAGVELFVLDDGWFREDNSSRSSMGDWECNQEKIPGGIAAAADVVHRLGMKFGLWFEPEAVGPTSKLFAQHPEWILHVSGYEPALSRHEYLLDLSREDVRTHVLTRLAEQLDTGKVDYVKWDMNRPLTDVCCTSGLPWAGGDSHRYVLGLYQLLDEFSRRWPNVLLEGCSSGGCRLDPGILAYVAQNWASDNTDAVDRTTIQQGLSLTYPPSILGAHVSAVPNHQTGRTATLSTRYQVARQFCLGYELDLSACSQGELESIAAQIEAHKAERGWMEKSSFHRLETSDSAHVAWASASNNQSDIVVLAMQLRHDVLSAHHMLRLPFVETKGLWINEVTGNVYGGDELASIGLPVPVLSGDNKAIVWELKRID